MFNPGDILEDVIYYNNTHKKRYVFVLSSCEDYLISEKEIILALAMWDGSMRLYHRDKEKMIRSLRKLC